MKNVPQSEPMVTFDVDMSSVELDLESVWPALERGGFRRSAMVDAQVNELLPIGRALVRTRGLGLLYEASLMSPAEMESLPAPIRSAEFLCFGVCTAGQAIDDRARDLRAAGELVDSMILDAMALTDLSCVGDEVARRIFAWAKENGLAASRAFSPGAGAGQWELSGQRLVFDHLPPEPLGVCLTKHFLMQPSKSISFVIGIGENVKQAANPFSCEGCSQVECAYRHIPSDEMVGEGAS